MCSSGSLALADEAILDAMARGGDTDKIEEAEAAVEAGDVLRGAAPTRILSAK